MAGAIYTMARVCSAIGRHEGAAGEDGGDARDLPALLVNPTPRRHDFGMGLKSCSHCKKRTRNQGCKTCSSRLCKRCFADHLCLQPTVCVDDETKATEDHQSRDITAPLVEDIVEVSVTDRRPEVSSLITQKIADALKLSAENGTLQSCLEKRSNGNTIETTAMSTEAPQAEVVCETEPVAKMASLSSSHVTTSKESEDEEKKNTDESELPAPRVVAPYLSHVTTTKESGDEEKNISDESEPAPRVMAPYMSHVTSTIESEPCPSKESAEHEKNISDESEPAPSKESADHVNKISDESEPVPRVVAPYLSHVTTTKESEPAPFKESTDHEKDDSDLSEPAPSKEPADHEKKSSDESESAGHERKISDEFEPVPRVVAPYLSHMTTPKESAEEPEKVISAESEPAPREEQGEDISNELEPAPRVAIPYLKHIVASSASAEEPEKPIPVESEPIVTSPKGLAEEPTKVIPDESEPVPRVAVYNDRSKELDQFRKLELTPVANLFSLEGEERLSLAFEALYADCKDYQEVNHVGIVAESLEDALFVLEVAKSEDVPYQLQPSVGTWQLSLRPDQKFAATQKQEMHGDDEDPATVLALVLQNEVGATGMADPEATEPTSTPLRKQNNELAESSNSLVPLRRLSVDSIVSVGSPVVAKDRFGEVIVHDPEDLDLTYKVAFPDGTADWFPQDAVQSHDPESSEAERLHKEAEAAEAEAAQKAAEEEEIEMRLAQQEVEAWCKTRGFQHVNAERKTFKGKKYPLHSAVKHQDVKIVKQLIKCGARKDLKDSRGQTPVQLAEKLCNNGSKDGSEYFAIMAQSILAELR